jgi:hypothetical protein
MIPVPVPVPVLVLVLIRVLSSLYSLRISALL